MLEIKTHAEDVTAATILKNLHIHRYVSLGVKSMEGPCKYWQIMHFVTIKNSKAVLLTIRDGSVITKLCAAVARYPQRESSKILNVSHRWRKNPLFKRLLDRWEKESVNFREQEIRILLLSALFYYGSPRTSNIFFIRT